MKSSDKGSAPAKTVSGQNELSLVIDKDSGLPLCVLLQAIYNPTGYHMPHFIPAECWQLDPPKTPMLVAGTVDQWKSVVPRMIEKANARKAISVLSASDSDNASS